MLDNQLIGKRCRMSAFARDNRTGAPMRGLTGTIRRRVENLGRTLVLVDWDTRAEATFVFPTDLEFLEDNRVNAGQ